MKKYLFLFIISFSLLVPIHAQTLEGVFSCQGEESVVSTIQLTTIGGQPFEGTIVGTPLSYGFIETVSTVNESSNVFSFDLEENNVSAELGEQLQLVATFSPEVVDNPTLSWFSSDPTVATVEDGVVSALQEGKSAITAVSACGVYSDICEVTVSSDPTSIEKINTGNRVYPTVTKDYLNMDLQRTQTIYIINVAGQICAKVPCQVGQNTISMQTYPAGIYFIRMDNEVVKVVKQ